MVGAVNLTKRTVDAAEPGAARYTLWDSGLRGLGLRVAPTGQKTYVLRYRADGQRFWYTIGEHGSPWTPDAARKKAAELLKSGNPQSGKKSAMAMPTIARLCDDYFAEGVAHKKPGTIAADRGRIEHHIKPLIGRVKADKLTKADVGRLFTAVREGKTAGRKEGAKKGGGFGW